MIYPEALYNFLKTCRDPMVVGRVCQALGKQDVELSPVEETFLAMIRNSSDWMDEKLDAKRERDRKRQAEYRKKHEKGEKSSKLSTDVDNSVDEPGEISDLSHLSHVVTCDRCHVTPCRCDVTPVTHHTTIQPTNHTTNHTTRYVGVRGVQGGDERQRQRQRGEDALAQEARRFTEAVKSAPDGGAEAFFSPDFHPAAMMLALTSDMKSRVRWMQLARSIPEDALREELYAFHRELQIDTPPLNRGAVLNKRLHRIAKKADFSPSDAFQDADPYKDTPKGSNAVEVPPDP